MARATFKSKKEQIIFFQKVLFQSGCSLSSLAERCGVVRRTLFCWRKGEYLSDYDTVISLCTEFNISTDGIKKLDDYWYTAKGGEISGKARFEKYGNIGTREGRIKGGMVAQQRRREDPEKYRQLGCNIRKVFETPAYSREFAEVVGIILGDGAISDHQVRISLDCHRDKEYAEFVKDLMGKVLGERPSHFVYDDSVIALTISGIGLVEMLEGVGMQRGDKVRHQVSFPQWIREDPAYSIACVRGLFDTDGGLYFHKKEKRNYLGWCFASFSDPLLFDVMNTLQKLNFNVKKSGAHKLYMYSLKSISRYFEIVGSHNPKNAVKLELRRGRIVV